MDTEVFETQQNFFRYALQQILALDIRFIWKTYACAQYVMHCFNIHVVLNYLGFVL